MKNPFRHSPEVSDLLEKLEVYRDRCAALTEEVERQKDENKTLRNAMVRIQTVNRLQSQAITNIGVALKALADQLTQ